MWLSGTNVQNYHQSQVASGEGQQARVEKLSIDLRLWRGAIAAERGGVAVRRLQGMGSVSPAAPVVIHGTVPAPFPAAAMVHRLALLTRLRMHILTECRKK